jgi:hypothetical protein
MDDGYEKGWYAARDLCLALAEKRLSEKSRPEHLLQLIDQANRQAVIMQQKWFSSGRHSAAQNITDEIRALSLKD